MQCSSVLQTKPLYLCLVDRALPTISADRPIQTAMPPKRPCLPYFFSALNPHIITYHLSIDWNQYTLLNSSFGEALHVIYAE